MNEGIRTPLPETVPHPTGNTPHEVHLVCLGQSTKTDYVTWMLQKQQQAWNERTEVWTVNRGVRVFAADAVFVLDELEREMRLDPAYAQALERYSGPIITTKLHKSRPGRHVYPARAVLDCLGIQGDPYWHNSVPMVIAYALALKVQRLAIWGADYTLPDGRVLEAERANCEYWLGFAAARGMRIGLSDNTTLMNRVQTRGQTTVYGLLDKAESQEFLDGWPNQDKVMRDYKRESES